MWRLKSILKKYKGDPNKMIRYGKQSLLFKIKDRFTNKFSLNIENKTYYNQYGRVIPLSIGLFLGLVIDKVLLYITKGLSVCLPPFAALLMNKGYTFKEIRFEKDFGSLEFLVGHFVR